MNGALQIKFDWWLFALRNAEGNEAWLAIISNSLFSVEHVGFIDLDSSGLKWEVPSTTPVCHWLAPPPAVGVQVVVGGHINCSHPYVSSWQCMYSLQQSFGHRPASLPFRLFRLLQCRVYLQSPLCKQHSIPKIVFFSPEDSNLIIKLLNLSFTKLLYTLVFHMSSHWVLATSVSSLYHSVPPDTHWSTHLL